MLQLKYGKKHETLRSANTVEALEALLNEKIILKKEYQILTEGLLFLKKLENLLRLLHDRSINELYESDFQKLAAELDPNSSADKLRQKYDSTTKKIRQIYEKYFSSK